MLPDREEACCGGDICHIQQLSPSRTDNINTSYHIDTEILLIEDFYGNINPIRYEGGVRMRSNTRSFPRARFEV